MATQSTEHLISSMEARRKAGDHDQVVVVGAPRFRSFGLCGRRLHQRELMHFKPSRDEMLCPCQRDPLRPHLSREVHPERQR